MKLIVGVRGTGKTKQLIEMVNKAAEESKGSVICIEYSNKLNFDITYKARLIDATKFHIDDAHKLTGFVAGIAASNHDITDLFIDSALKICNGGVGAKGRGAKAPRAHFTTVRYALGQKDRAFCQHRRHIGRGGGVPRGC